MRSKLSKKTLDDLSLLMRATKVDNVYVQDWNISDGWINITIQSEGKYHRIRLKGYAIQRILCQVSGDGKKELKRRLRQSLQEVGEILGLGE